MPDRQPGPAPPFDPGTPLGQAIETLLLALPSPGSRRVYASDLRGYFAWCAREGERPEAIERSALLRYLEFLAVECHLAPTTRRRQRTVLHRLYEELIESGVHPGPNPVRRLPRLPEGPSSIAPALDADETARLLAFGDLADLRAARDATLLLLLYLTGLRAAEASGLRWGDRGVERGHPTLFVRRKGGGRVAIKSSLALEVALDTWRARLVDADLPAGRNAPVFPGRLRRPLAPISTRSISRIADRELARVGRVGHRTAAHLLRKTSITDVYLASHDVLLAQRHAGHRQTATTVRHYIDPADRLADSGIDYLSTPGVAEPGDG